MMTLSYSLGSNRKSVFFFSLLLLFFSCKTTLDSPLSDYSSERLEKTQNTNRLYPSKISQYGKKGKLERETILTYNYDNKLETVYVQSKGAPNEFFCNYIYDTKGRLNKINVFNDEGELFVCQYEYFPEDKTLEDLVQKRILSYLDEGSREHKVYTEAYSYDDIARFKTLEAYVEGHQIDSLGFVYQQGSEYPILMKSKFQIISEPCFLNSYFSYNSCIRNPFYGLELIDEIYTIPSLDFTRFAEKYSVNLFREIKSRVIDDDDYINKQEDSMFEYSYFYTELWENTNYPSKYKVRVKEGNAPSEPYRSFEIEY